MANVLNASPLVLDGSSLGTVIIPYQLKILHVEFTNYTGTTAATLQLADRFGHVFCNMTGTSDGQEVRTAKVGWTHGIQEITHTSGVALVYFE